MKINRTLITCASIALLFFGIPNAHAQVSDSEGCSLSAWVMQQQPHSTRTLEAPPPVLRDTVITINEAQQHISLPLGFTMTVFARNILFCRGLACSPDGVIYATAYDGDVYALPDPNHTGFADSTIIVATSLNDPHGIGFYKGKLYVSNDSALYRFVTSDTSRVAQSMIRIASLPITGDHHSRNFVIDSIKGKIYLQIGSDGNFDTNDVAHRAQIVEMNLDGSDYRTFATGTRNPVGMDLDPRTDALWVNNNGMDDLFEGIFPDNNLDLQLTANNPSESIYLVCDGANYGWPYCYGFRLRNPQQPWASLDTDIVQTFDGPVAEVLAHSAPLGLHFYRGTKFPALYHNAIFQCYHGSWDRTPPAPPRITVMWADTDGKNARVTDFVNGFDVLGPNADSNTATYFGRPVSIIEGADSALYVSDDVEGCVYRIAYTGSESSVAPTPDAMRFAVANPVPNPATNGLSAELTLSESAIVRAEVFDEVGNTVEIIIEHEMSAGKHTLTVDTSKLSSGNYILRVTSGGEVVSRSFIIER